MVRDIGIDYYFLNLLFLNAFSTVLQEFSGLVYLQMDTAFYHLSSRLLHWI